MVASTTNVLGVANLPSTSTGDGFGTLLGLALIAVAAAFFILRRRMA